MGTGSLASAQLAAKPGHAAGAFFFAYSPPAIPLAVIGYAVRRRVCRPWFWVMLAQTGLYFVFFVARSRHLRIFLPMCAPIGVWVNSQPALLAPGGRHRDSAAGRRLAHRERSPAVAVYIFRCWPPALIRQPLARPYRDEYSRFPPGCITTIRPQRSRHLAKPSRRK